MDSKTEFEAALALYHPKWIDGSKRGSGLNAVWRIQTKDGPIILKTYDSRRSPIQSVLTEIGNLLTGLTSYAATNRCKNESECLKLWHAAGFRVPKLVDFKPAIPLPTPFIAMEEIQGRLLIDILSDSSIPENERERILECFVQDWHARHEHALKTNDPRLIQKHGSFAHVFFDGKNFTTFDLEVSHRNRSRIERLVGREIFCYLQSLAKKVQPEDFDKLTRIIVEKYPKKPLIERTCADLLEGESVLKRTFHSIVRRLPRSKRPYSKYNIAKRVLEIIKTA